MWWVGGDVVPGPMPKRLYFLHSGFMISGAAKLLQESALTREHDGRSGSYNLLFRSRITSENSEIGPPRLMLRRLQPRSLSKIWPSEVLNQTGERTLWSEQVGGVVSARGLGYSRNVVSDGESRHTSSILFPSTFSFQACSLSG
jgi:hypothetical protein